MCGTPSRRILLILTHNTGSTVRPFRPPPPPHTHTHTGKQPPSVQGVVSGPGVHISRQHRVRTTAHIRLRGVAPLRPTVKTGVATRKLRPQVGCSTCESAVKARLVRISAGASTSPKKTLPPPPTPTFANIRHRTSWVPRVHAAPVRPLRESFAAKPEGAEGPTRSPAAITERHHCFGHANGVERRRLPRPIANEATQVSDARA